jgi:hypothetical protein
MACLFNVNYLIVILAIFIAGKSSRRDVDVIERSAWILAYPEGISYISLFQLHLLGSSSAKQQFVLDIIVIFCVKVF